MLVHQSHVHYLQQVYYELHIQSHDTPQVGAVTDVAVDEFAYYCELMDDP